MCVLLHREALEQQLKQTEAASTEQLQSARQAAITQAVQHSNQYQADLERAAGQRKQLQQQVQGLQAALAAKESELAAVQMQLAAALESAKRAQENHGKVSWSSRHNCKTEWRPPAAAGPLVGEHLVCSGTCRTLRPDSICVCRLLHFALCVHAHASCMCSPWHPRVRW